MSTAALTFAEEKCGFADCLRNMKLASEQGVEIDFSDWGESAARLIGLTPEALNALIDLYLEFHGQNCSKGIRKAESLGFASHKGAIPDNFSHEVERWLSREISAAEAAKNCGMKLGTFYAKARKNQKKETKLEKVEEVIKLWASGGATVEEACALLGVSARTFRRMRDVCGISREEDNFARYVKLYSTGTLTKNEAARLSGMTVAEFNQRLK